MEHKFDLDIFTYKIINNQIIINLKENDITKDELLNTDLTYSSILDVTINNEICDIKSYKGILDYLLCNFTAKKLKEISIFKHLILDGEHHKNGYYYLELPNISFVVLSSNASCKEIINLISHLNIKFYIKIKLVNGNIVKFTSNVISY
jgi:hypothetical protein